MNSKNKMEFYLNHGYNNLKEFEEKIFTPGIDMYLNASSFQVRHHWHPNKNFRCCPVFKQVHKAITMV